MILPRQVKNQPSLRICEWGDCGGCVLAGLFDKTVEETYKIYKREPRNTPFSYHEMIQALEIARFRGEATDILTECPEWPSYPALMQYGRSSWLQFDSWFRYIKMGMQAGYYAICSVSLHNLGPLGSPPHDHWVLLNGYRQTETEIRVPGTEIVLGKRIDQEIQISCPVNYTEWMAADKFLTTKGGFNALLVRPAS
jgi:hypothetical protein